MAIANFSNFEELPSRLFLLSTQTLALFSKSRVGEEVTEFDLMNLNGLYRLLSDFKANELGDHATTGVLGFETGELFDQASASAEAQITSHAISSSLNTAYGLSDPMATTLKLQQALVKLAGLTPTTEVTTADVDQAQSALSEIVKNLKIVSATPSHA